MKCPECDQPMLPKGKKKKQFEYDHAQGCLLEPHNYRHREAALKAFVDAADALRSSLSQWLDELALQIKGNGSKSNAMSISYKCADAIREFDAARAKLGG